MGSGTLQYKCKSASYEHEERIFSTAHALIKTEYANESATFYWS